MHFALTLHSHLPYLLNHGRWPHGSDWLCEAALDSYLPLISELLLLEQASVPAPLTLGITPVLASQLMAPQFASELESFLDQRIQACSEAPASLSATGETHLLPLVEYWRARFVATRSLFRQLEGDLIGAFRRLESAGRIELITSAATHAFLPLLGRDESIRLQLALGMHEHEMIFGRAPRGCWLPECAYRPEGEWNPLPGISTATRRPGVETHLRTAGFRYFFLDTHLAPAGEAVGSYGDVCPGAEPLGDAREGPGRRRSPPPTHSPHQAFLVGTPSDARPLAAFVREPRTSRQVWSRHHGYPGDEWYLEFHKIRWPGGLRFWRVTDPHGGLGEKEPYEPQRARDRSREHAAHFACLLGELRRVEGAGDLAVAAVPFDTELFGHWWHEGTEFLRTLFRDLAGRVDVTPVTASQHLDAAPPDAFLRPEESSWGAGGDFRMWLNEGTHWSWERMWRLEDRFWNLAGGSHDDTRRRPILAAAGRQLVLAQSSDWQFMISTGAVPDYGSHRFRLHADEAEALLAALEPGATEGSVEAGLERSAELEHRDTLFPDLLETLEEVLAQPPGH